MQASQPLSFVLEFDLFASVEKAYLEPNSVGKLTIVLKKQNEELCFGINLHFNFLTTVESP